MSPASSGTPPEPPAAASLPWLEVCPSGALAGEIAAPASKSVTNRLLAVAALAAGTSWLVRPLESDDTDAMAEGLRAFGAGIADVRHLRRKRAQGTADGPVLAVEGTDGRPSTPCSTVDARQSGTTLRFLAPFALLAGGTTTFDGAPSLRRRPIGGLAEALAALGAGVRTAGGFPPLAVRSRGLPGGRVRVDAAASSQFASALLLVAPYAAADLAIEVSHLGAGGYVELTVQVMRRFGAVVDREDGSYTVRAGSHYAGRCELVEYDASAAAHLFSLAVASGGEVTVTNAREGSLQPDARVVELFALMGSEVARSGSEVSVRGAGRPLPIEADLSSVPDQLPTLAALAALAEGTSRFSGLAVSRGHETDRLAAVATELERLGARVRAGEDWLEVEGGGRLRGGEVETYGDHRMAMAFAALGARIPGVRIRDPGCVAKTYPRFFEDAASLGLVVRGPGGS